MFRCANDPLFYGSLSRVNFILCSDVIKNSEKVACHTGIAVLLNKCILFFSKMFSLPLSVPAIRTNFRFLLN